MKYLRHEILIKAFGNRVRILRKAKGVTIQDMAYSMDMEHIQLSRIERGVINTSISHAYSIAQYFNMSLNELFEFEIK